MYTGYGYVGKCAHELALRLSSRKLLRDNYDTQTSKDYRGYEGSSGREPLPSGLSHALSGFAHNQPRTTPTTNQVPTCSLPSLCL